MLPPVFQALKSSPQVTALIGTSPMKAFRHGVAPQGAAAPYVVWSAVGTEPANHLSGIPGMDRVNIEVDCYSTDDAEVSALATAVRDAIEPYAHMTGVSVDTRETDTMLYRTSLTFDWFLPRV